MTFQELGERGYDNSEFGGEGIWQFMIRGRGDMTIHDSRERGYDNS